MLRRFTLDYMAWIHPIVPATTKHRQHSQEGFVRRALRHERACHCSRENLGR